MALSFAGVRIESNPIGFLHSPSELTVRGFLAQLEDCPDSFNDADSGGIDSDELSENWSKHSFEKLFTAKAEEQDNSELSKVDSIHREL